MDDHGNLITMARQCLVDRIVHHLEDHVVEAGPIACVPNIHPGSFAHRI